MASDNRSLYIFNKNLETYAEHTALSMNIGGELPGKAAAAELKKSLRLIEAETEKAALKWQGLAAMPGAVRWLLDNCYLVQREAMAAIEALAGQRQLRCTSDGTVVLLLCQAYMRSGSFELNEERLSLFLGGFQKAVMLSREELALIPDGLRWALITELSQRCRDIHSKEKSQELEDLFKNIFTCLHQLSGTDLGPIIEDSDLTERLLRRDPAGVYPLMDENSRTYYRQKLSALAKKRSGSEYELARLILALAKKGSGEKSHIGYWILQEPLGTRPLKRRGGAYISALLLLTVFLSLFFGFAADSFWASILLLIPVSELVKSLMDFILLRITPATQLPRLELKEGIPPEGRTLCAISCIVDSEENGRKLAKRLEQHRLCSRDAGNELLFGLIADLPDTKEADIPFADTWMSSAASAINELNNKYGGGFFLLTRARVKSSEGRYMGWERKRGAILETMRLIRGFPSAMECLAGDSTSLEKVHFLLTLDSDTRLTPESARQLTGAMLHPLNRPRVDGKKKIVSSGHGIISPRIGLELSSAVKSDFSKVFAGQGGCDPYSGACGELYMDTWHSGSFAGKGIIDIDAYLECMEGRIDENSVLSHDAIEGAYLRGAFMGNCEFIDSFPGSPMSYYKRQHRWVRGDWQNLPWLFKRGRDLPDIERFRLFDSLRRSLVPVMSFAAIYVGFFLHPMGFVIAAAAAALSCACQLIFTIAQCLLRSEEEVRVRYHSGIFHGVGGGLARTVLYLILLPIEACYNLDAIMKALYRLLISHKNMLQWQTAGQSDAQKSGLTGCLIAMWPATALGLAALLLAPSILGRAVGLIWLLSPICAYILGMSAPDSTSLLPSDREYLLESIRQMWTYFDTFLNESDHFLPPDNFQSQPPKGLARRTSPTNIGLSLLSCLSALELGITDKSRCMYLIENCLDTIEKLKKWHGHLYNWYNTETLEPLTPEFISTVDSGNLYGCLAALEQALKEHDRPDLSARVDHLLSAMDFKPLYDEKRRLFHTGFDLEKNALSPSWYDLMSSEARLTAYIAIAKGDAPRRHWQKLSRAMVQKNSYRGMVSWTGTMFEYLMPEILLPLYKDSLLYESALFCLYAQKRRGSVIGSPWGISESAFFSLDPSMNYRYKAHGCAALALKRGMDEEAVISPYSSFLALVLSPAAAVKNLRKLESLGMVGKFGFWEALDRTGGREGIVRCVMSHHLGMSICAGANCLLNNIWPRRFMSRPEMSAYDLLLQEKVPLGGRVLRRRGGDSPVKPRRSFDEKWEKRGEGTNFLQPECCQLSSLSYSLMLSESGLSRALWGAVSPYVPSTDALDDDHGINFFFSFNGEEHTLLPDSRENKAQFSWRFTPEKADISFAGSEFSSQLSSFLPRDCTGEVRLLQIKNGAAPIKGQVSLRFKPLLAKNADYVNQPAFWKLGISVKAKNNCLIVRRLARNSCPELYLCLAADREGIFECCPALGSVRYSGSRPIRDQEYFPAQLELSWRCDADIAPNSSFSCGFALCMGHSETEATEAALTALSLNSEEAAAMPRRAAAVLGMNADDFDRSWALLSYLHFSPPSLADRDTRQSELWKFGISGDLPIVCADFTNENQLPYARQLMDSHLLICAGGCDFDLVFISHDGASYHKPLNTALDELLWKNGGDLLSGARGGVHIVAGERGVEALWACAAARIDLSQPLSAKERKNGYRKLLVPQRKLPPAQEAIKYGWNENHVFSFSTHRSLPQRVWSNMLTNGRLGYLACDSGCGNLWYLNSREMQLSTWLGEDTAVNGPESLMLEAGGMLCSLFAAGDGFTTKISFGFGTAIWEKSFGGTKSRVTAFIPDDTDARVFIIELENAENAMLHWRLGLHMGGGRYVNCRNENGLFSAQSLRWQGPGFSACISSAVQGFTTNGRAALAGSYDSAQGCFESPVFAAQATAEKCTVIVCGCCEKEKLRSLCAPQAAKAALEKTKQLWQKRCGYLELKSQVPELDNIIGGWAAYQALACRSMGRCGLYQAGGAYGFRDQLQDSVNLIPLSSVLAKEQILRCCRRQYLEGDVQHWWHETAAETRGVRTHCSDDLLWLPWALCEYVEKTGDEGICFEKAEYISSQPLSPDDHDRYESAVPSGISGSVLEHCCRAMDMILSRGTGSHGLLCFGSGDWNDGLDKVGGESQWLTWFFIITALRFTAILEKLRPGERFPYGDIAHALAKSANEAWDGQWFLRGYFADGQPLGSRKNHECSIDSIAQSFAALCPLAESDKVQKALDSALERLYDIKHGLAKLFTPPFSGKGPHPGYIESYGPGFRENGGQYTHAALWLVMALLRLDRCDDAWRLLKTILPGGREISRYKGEPYVISADVWSALGHEGEAGWTWYTGSAGWLLRIVSEELLGLRLIGGKLYIRPKLPTELQGYRASYYGHDIQVSPQGIKFDGQDYNGAGIEL